MLCYLKLANKKFVRQFYFEELKTLSLNAERLAINFKDKRRKHFELFHKTL